MTAPKVHKLVIEKHLRCMLAVHRRDSVDPVERMPIDAIDLGMEIHAANRKRLSTDTGGAFAGPSGRMGDLERQIAALEAERIVAEHGNPFSSPIERRSQIMADEQCVGRNIGQLIFPSDSTVSNRHCTHKNVLLRVGT
jgi:hypothetical protein